MTFGVLFSAPSMVQAAHLANHLVISEVAFDVAGEPSTAGAASAEYFEIFNPTDATISLNEGAIPGTSNGKGSYFLTDSPTGYYNVVNGKVNLASVTTDLVVQFPVGYTIPPKGTVVVCSDSAEFLRVFFSSSLENFLALPGEQQLFETRPDGLADSVPDMVYQSSYSTTTTNIMLNLTNGGEPAVLFYWDGSSDLVKDVDIAVWVNSSQIVKKTAAIGVDGPDVDITLTYFKADSGQITSLGPSVTMADTQSLQRRNLEEPNEVDAGGNGITGQDETSENWGLIGGSANTNWQMTSYTPGVPLLSLDGNISDSVSFLSPVAVSGADGPGGTALPQDYGADGSLTELYLTSIDTDADRVVDSLYFMVRGSLFGEPDDAANASFVLFDLEPGSGEGVQNLVGVANELSDERDALSSALTHAGFSLSSAAGDLIGFDGAAGIDQSIPTASQHAGWRTWGTDGTAGTVSEFTTVGTYTSVRFDGGLSALYPAAEGASYAAQDGFEGLLSFASLAGGRPEYLAAVAVTTAGNGAAASPNTLPESSSDSFSFPQELDRVVCIETATGTVVSYYRDADGDGYGGIRSAYCGPLIAGYVLNSDDCNDASSSANPAASEVCDGVDNDCDGSVDEGFDATFVYFDADLDGYGDPATARVDCAPDFGEVTVADDCDDSDAEINPAAEEACDDLDNDCNGSVDDDLTQYTFYTDGDGDGYGAGSSSTDCEVPVGASVASGDCNDGMATSHPGASELCDGIDNDCDGAGEVDGDGDGVLTCAGDCDDGNASRYPGATELCDALDNNCDGQVPSIEQDGDADGQRGCQGDCDDTNPDIFQGATEVCDTLDNDCDGGTDEGVTSTWYADDDGDGFGNPLVTVQACTLPIGFVATATDCLDSDAGVFPGAAEVCDLKDNDCDGTVDEGVTTVYFRDVDGDGYGLSSDTREACSAPSGYAASSGDCNDADATSNPAATEVCDARDNDCDGAVDEEVQTTYYLDGDHDGYGDPVGAVLSCSAPTDHVAIGQDCNDADPAVNPGATEQCDGEDNDCDGTTDEGVKTTYYLDSDGDGHGTSSTSIQGCSRPAGYSVSADDCDDGNASSYSGATEICDGLDNDCDGGTDEGVTTSFYQDEDGDGFGVTSQTTQACSVPVGYSATGGDCNDHSSSINPNVVEICDAQDNDCDGATDESGGTTTFYVDGDGDGYGVVSSSVVACEVPVGYAAQANDCNDANSAINPGATETCDLLDNDCDGVADEGVTSTWYRDNDHDGWGAEALEACTRPSGSVIVGGDCDDTDDGVYPSATELCDGIDNNCDGRINENTDSDLDGYSVCQGDCDDDNALILPGAVELCDGIDNDCTLETDESGDVDQDGYTVCELDCDDSDASVSPSSEESCNGIDDDCDGEIDESFATDGDEDGFDSQACGGTDCDDTDASVNPDASDIPGDDIDQDCSGEDAFDIDGDGYAAPEDCDDTNATVYPAAEEMLCNDGLDNDCDRLSDLADADCSIDHIDTDLDGLSDAQELALGTDPSLSDTDGDGLEDGEEVLLYLTNPLLIDTDGDELSDGDELHHPDEATDPLEVDTDGDGILDSVEVEEGCDLEAAEADTDLDGLEDGEESKDLDCEVDEGETSPLNSDTDSDGLSDRQEVQVYFTNPLIEDTDGDGVEDGQEVDDDTDPLDPNDYNTGEDETPVGDDDTTGGDDDTTGGDDDTTGGDDDTTGGDDDTTGGDDDTTGGDDDTTGGDDDTTGGDDDTTGGDDDTTGGDDDTTGGDDDSPADTTPGGDDDGQSCQCSTGVGSTPLPAGTFLLWLCAATAMVVRNRRR